MSKNKKNSKIYEEHIKESKNEEEFVYISLFRNPIETLKTLSVILFEQFQNLLAFIRNNFVIVFLFSVFISIMNFVQGPHSIVYKLLFKLV